LECGHVSPLSAWSLAPVTSSVQGRSCLVLTMRDQLIANDRPCTSGGTEAILFMGSIRGAEL
jgi:hypothetical protein